MDKVLFTKENIDNLLFQLAKEYKKLNRKNIPAEIVILGGAAIVSKYGFRPSTTDIDDNYPKLLNKGNLASVLEAAKRKRVRESKE